VHETLVAGLKADDENVKVAYEGRPDPECIQQQLNNLRHKVTADSCVICMDDFTILDGVLCRADGHFVCNDGFTNHVRAGTNSTLMAISTAHTSIGHRQWEGAKALPTLAVGLHGTLHEKPFRRSNRVSLHFARNSVAKRYSAS